MPFLGDMLVPCRVCVFALCCRQFSSPRGRPAKLVKHLISWQPKSPRKAAVQRETWGCEKCVYKISPQIKGLKTNRPISFSKKDGMGPFLPIVFFNGVIMRPLKTAENKLDSLGFLFTPILCSKRPLGPRFLWPKSWVKPPPFLAEVYFSFKFGRCWVASFKQ